MMRRTQNRWSQLKVGLVLLIALGGLLVAVMNLDEGVGIFTPRAMLRAHLDDSQGLKVGAPVRMNGVDVLKKIRARSEFHNTPVIVFTRASSKRSLTCSFGSRQIFRSWPRSCAMRTSRLRWNCEIHPRCPSIIGWSSIWA